MDKPGWREVTAFVAGSGIALVRGDRGREAAMMGGRSVVETYLGAALGANLHYWLPDYTFAECLPLSSAIVAAGITGYQTGFRSSRMIDDAARAVFVQEISKCGGRVLGGPKA